MTASGCLESGQNSRQWVYRLSTAGIEESWHVLCQSLWWINSLSGLRSVGRGTNVASIVVFDEEMDSCNLLRRILEGEGHAVTACGDRVMRRFGLSLQISARPGDRSYQSGEQRNCRIGFTHQEDEQQAHGDDNFRLLFRGRGTRHRRTRSS